MKKALMAFDEGEKPQSSVCKFDSEIFAKVLEKTEEDLMSDK